MHLNLRKYLKWGLGVGIIILTIILAAACQGPAGPQGPAGATGPAGPAGAEGPAGATGPLAPGVERGMDLSVSISNPSNGNYFEDGERITISIEMTDGQGNPRTKDDYAAMNLYMYGPQDPVKTVSANKLLRASVDRSQRPHHYIDLLTNADATVNGNVIEYVTEPISDEEAGTYSATVWSYLKDETSQRTFEVSNFQVKTQDVEAAVIDSEKCGSCHFGTISGQYYFHHVDPGYSPTGLPELDSVPVATCKSCHNNDGYAAYAIGSERIPDPIINRIHGVHNGSHLENLKNIGTDTEDGVFHDYLTVHFPADVRNCTRCHADDRWKTEPSRLACGTCHDNVSFESVADIPEGEKAHEGGPQNNDGACAVCHTPSATEGGLVPITEAHAIEDERSHEVKITMMDPRNGEYYVSGERPVVTVTLTDKTSGLSVDGNAINETNWDRVRMHVSGPRKHTKPVLTEAAADNSLSGSSSYIYVDLRKDIYSNLVRESRSVTYQLDDVDGLDAGTYTIFVQALPKGGSSTSVGLINFQVGTADIEKPIATNCTECHGETNMHGSYPFSLAPDLCKSCHDYEQQLEGHTSWTDRQWGFGAGVMVKRIHGVHFGNYLEKPEDVYANFDRFDVRNIIFPQDVRNCTKCHGDNRVWIEEPSRLACNACHDSDEAITHTSLMTIDPTPENPWGGDEMESCTVCHGDGRDYSPDRVHSISDPYEPPYAR